MKHAVYSIYDVKLKVYGRPELYNDELDVRRKISMAFRNPGVYFARTPEDFKLFELGVFDDLTGIFTLPEFGKPEFVCDLSELDLRGGDEN